MKLILGFSTTRTIPSRLIRWAIGGQVSHTYIRFHDDFLDADLVWHADWPGVIIEDAELFNIQNIVVDEFEIDDPRIKSALKKNLKMLRKKYALWNLAKWAWFITFKRWVKKKIANPIKNPKKLICVDFALHVLNASGVTDLPYDYYNPKSLRGWAIENYELLGWKRTLHNVEI